MIPKLFTPLKIRSITIPNRVMLPPMCMYSAKDGIANDFHLTHYTTRAMGKVGLIIMEATGVVPNGRITPYCLGLWSDQQIDPLKRITQSIKQYGSVPGIQIGHSGRKGSTNQLWAGSLPMDRFKGGFPVCGPSKIPFSNDGLIPHELTIEEIKDIEDKFAEAAGRAVKAGFDAIEVHGAHGYLLQEFLSPLSNHRNDIYGGSLENRQRILFNVASKIRKEIGNEKGLMVRMSCVDWVEGGWTIDDTISTVKGLQKLGVDLVDSSSGGNIPDYKPAWGKGFQVPFSHAIKKATTMPTVAVGMINHPGHANEILEQGRADMVAIGRELLKNPFWVHDAAEYLKHDLKWIPQYVFGTKIGNPYENVKN